MKKTVHKCFDCQKTHINNQCPFCKSTSFATIEVSESEYNKAFNNIENYEKNKGHKFCQSCGNRCVKDAIMCVNCHAKFEINNTTSYTSEKTSTNPAHIFACLGLIGGFVFPGPAATLSILAIFLDRKEKKSPFKLGIFGIFFNIFAAIFFSLILYINT